MSKESFVHIFKWTHQFSKSGGLLYTLNLFTEFPDAKVWADSPVLMLSDEFHWWFQWKLLDRSSIIRRLVTKLDHLLSGKRESFFCQILSHISFTQFGLKMFILGFWIWANQSSLAVRTNSAVFDFVAPNTIFRVFSVLSISLCDGLRGGKCALLEILNIYS